MARIKLSPERRERLAFEVPQSAQADLARELSVS
jgi:hypothetical protein